MGKETSFKQRGASVPDSSVGRKAVELGLISKDQLREAMDRLSEEPASHPEAKTLAAALVACGFLTKHQIDILVENPPALRQVGKYRLGKKLGRGGMGVVYEAEDRQLGRTVAIKMLRTMTDAEPQDIAEDEERFVREARFCAQLPKHPNIVTVYEAGGEGERRFIAMELIRGAQFQEWRQGKSIPFRLKVAVLRDVARAVEHAHRHGVIHRDLKPANILVDGDNIPHVTDFGLAKQMTSEAGGSLTCSGFLLGTPSYVSPEQAQGFRDVDLRTDVWALGVMLYELMTNRVPFPGINPMDILIKTIRDPVSPPSSNTRGGTLASTDRALERICMRALAKDPSERYPTAAAFADDLHRWLQGRRVMTSRASRPVRRRTVVAAAAGALVAALVAGVFALRSPGEAAGKPAGNRAATAGKKEAAEMPAAPARSESKPAAAPVAPALPPGGMVELPALRGHRSGVHLAVFSPDGRTLVTGSFDNSVRIWDVAGRAERKQVPASTMPFSLAVSGDGARIAAGYKDGMIRTWDATGSPSGAFAGHGHQVTGLAFTPDGKWLTSASTDGTARLWDLASGSEKSSATGFPKGAMCLALSRDGRTVAVGSAESMIRMLHVPSWEASKVFDTVHDSVIKGVAFSPNGKWLASGGKDSNVVLTEIESGRRSILAGHQNEVLRVAFSPDGRWIASVSQDNTLRVWDAQSGKPAGTLRAPEGYYAVTFSPGGELMAVGTGDGMVRFYNVMALSAAR